MEKLFFKLVETVNTFGPTTILVAYMVYDKVYADRENNKQLKEIQGTLVALSNQISMLLASALSYRNGNNRSGDAYSEQAIEEGKSIKKKHGGGTSD